MGRGTEPWILAVLKEGESGTPMAELTLRHGLVRRRTASGIEVLVLR